MTSGIVNASFSLPEGQAVKMIFFAPWVLSPLQDKTEYCMYITTHPLFSDSGIRKGDSSAKNRSCQLQLRGRYLSIRSYQYKPSIPHFKNTVGIIVTTIGRSDFWDCLGGQALVMILCWYSRHPNYPRNRCAESLYSDHCLQTLFLLFKFVTSETNEYFVSRTNALLVGTLILYRWRKLECRYSSSRNEQFIDGLNF